MGAKGPAKPDKFDDEMRARLVFYNQLAAGAMRVDRVRRRRSNDQSVKLPKDAADKFIERVGLASSDEAVPIPVRKVEDERNFTAQPMEGYEVGAEKFSDNMRRLSRAISASASSFAAAMGSLASLPAKGAQRLVSWRRPREHYEVGHMTPTARTHSRRLTMRSTIAIVSVALLLIAVGAASFLYFHQRAADHQRQAAQAQFERQHQAYICSLAQYELQQRKPVTVNTSGCGQSLPGLRY